MPRVSRWLIRAALLHLASGALLGAMYLMWKAGVAIPAAVSHLPVHQEQMLVGFLIQLVMGVAFWILPRQADDDPRGRGRVMWMAFGLLNGGVVAAALGRDPALPALLHPIGRGCETAAAALFALHAWHRQRPYRAQSRKVLV